MYKVLVCGSRNYKDRDKVYHVLDAYLARIGPEMFLINGGATGADDLARQWAVDRKVDHITLYAKWAIWGKGAGPRRNTKMRKLKPKLCLAFHEDPGLGRGTKNMVQQCQDNDIKVKRFIG